MDEDQIRTACMEVERVGHLYGREPTVALFRALFQQHAAIFAETPGADNWNDLQRAMYQLRHAQCNMEWPTDPREY